MLNPTVDLSRWFLFNAHSVDRCPSVRPPDWANWGEEQPSYSYYFSGFSALPRAQLWSHRSLLPVVTISSLIRSMFARYTKMGTGAYHFRSAFLQPFDRRNSTSVVLGAPQSAALVPPRKLVFPVVPIQCLIRSMLRKFVTCVHQIGHYPSDCLLTAI